MAMFDDLVEATPETEADTVKQNLFATEDIQPAHEAEVVNIADSFKTSPEFVRTSFADFQKKHLQPKPEEIDALSVTNPKTTSYMAQSPSMTALMKDKIPQMKSIEDTISEYGFLAKSYKALNAGTASAISGILKFPKLGYDVVANTIVNPIGEKLGFDPVKSEQYFQGGMLNETIKLFDDIAQSESGKVVELQDSILDQASKGNYEGAAKSIYYSTLQSMPNTLTAIVSTMAGNPAYGLASIFASASGSKYEENLKLQKERKAATPEELANKPQISDNEAILNAVSSGSIEVVTERLFGAFNGLKKSITPMVKILTKEAGAESTKQILKQTLKTMASSSAEEGFEEVLASGSNDFADYMMDVNPDALQMKGFVKRMVESGIVGASSGGFMTSPAALGLAYQQKRSIKQAQLNRDTLLAMGPKFNDPKFKEGLPKANRDFVAHTTKGTPLENVGVKIGVFDAYFQEKKLDPAQAAAEMGVSKEYDQAKATGDIVQIPITNWAERVVGTEVERGLIDDIKLKREADYDLSVNEAKEEKAKSVEQFNELQAQEEKQKTIEESTREISKDLETKLSNNGIYAKDQAKAMAFTMAESYRVRSEEVYAGRDPLEVYKTEGLKVLGFENTPEGMQGFEQASPQDKAAYNKANDARISLKNEIVDLMEANNDYLGFNSASEAIAEITKNGSGSLDLAGKVELAAKINDYIANDKEAVAIRSKFKETKKSKNETKKQADRTKQVRGFFDPVAKLIGLVKKNANLTTFMHEGGHVWLDQMAQDYKYLKSQTELNPKQEAYLERAETVLKYLEVKSFDEIKTEHHEKWARSFEAYLLEGKAPSERLLKAFKAFETWFLDIYKSIRGLEAEAGTKIELNAEIRDVFDRLLATDEEIQKAQKQYTPLFKDAIKAGMSKELANKWYKVSSEAGEAASALVTKPVMADYQKKQTALYKEERSKVKADLLETLLEMPEQKALTAIETDEQIKSMPVEIQAETFGYPVNDFKKIMDQARFDRTEGVNDLADAEMERRHPDSINELEEAAVEAVHNDKKAEQIRIEAEFLAEKLSDKAIAKRLIERLPNSKILKEEAIHRIALKNVEDIKPYVFERAERAASKEAADAFKKTEGKGVAETEELLQKAFDAKRRELLNHEMFKASIEAQKFVEKKVKEYKKLSKSDEKISAVRDIDYVNAARAVLANYGITRAEKTAEEYLDKVKRYEPKRYEGLINIVKSASDGADLYKKVSFNKFNQMTRAVDALWSLSKSTEQQTIDGVKMKREEVVKSLVDRSTDWVKSKASEAKYASTKAKHGGFKVFGMGIKAALTRIEPWVDFMDNGNPNGIFRKAIWAPVYDASVKYDLKKNEVMTNFKDKLHAYAKDFNKNPIAAGELLTNEDGKQLPFEFANKLELMMAILHRGNQSNLSKLLRGYGWGSEFDGVLDTSNWDAFEKRMIKEGVLTKADYDFAQGVWDMMESFKTDLQKTHKELEGYYFEEVTATEFKNEFGTYRGGYIPAKVDTKNVTDFKKLEEIDIFEKNNPSMAFPTAGAGALKTRNEAFAKRLSLDMNLLGAHIDWALRYTYFEPRVQEVSRLLNDNTFKEELKRIDPNIKEALESWLTRTAQQTVVVPGNNTLVKAIDPAARYLRTSAAMQVMFGNISNTVQQFTGLVVAMSKVKPRYVISGFSHWLTSFSREGNTSVTDMINKSEYMKSVQGTNIFEIQGAINELLANPNAFQKAQDFAVKHTYILQSAAQNIVNTSVWWGAYEQAIAKGLDENTAVQEADSTVRLTQGTNKAIDIAAFEVGSPTYRMFIQFAGYFNMLANLNVGEAGKIVNDVGVRKGGGRLFYLYMTGFMLPAFMSEVMMQAMAGKGFDADDDDEYMDDFLAMFAGSQFKTTTAMVPALGNFGTAAYNKVFTDKIYDDRVNMGLAISTLETLTDFPINLYKDIKNESVDTARTTKDFMSFIGNLSQTPLGALGKPTKYLIDVSKGDVQPTGPVDFTRGIFTGKKGERNR